MRAGHGLRHSLLMLLMLSLAVFTGQIGRGALRELNALEPVTVYRVAEPLQASDYQALKLREAQAVLPRLFALWSQQDAVVISAPGNGHTAEVSLLVVQGPPGLVIPGARMLAEHDGSGCLLDAKSAEKMFGSREIVGAAVHIGAMEYIVRGVLQNPGATAVIIAGSGDTAGLQSISVLGDTPEGPFPSRHNLRAVHTLSSESYVHLAGFFCAMPLLAVHLLLLFALRGCRRHWRSYIIRHVAATLCAFAVGTSLFLLLLRQIPPDFIPSRWADLEFWSSSIPQWAAQAFEYLTAAKLRPDLVYLYPLLRAALCWLSAHLLLGMYHLHRMYRRDVALAGLSQALQLVDQEAKNRQEVVGAERIG